MRNLFRKVIRKCIRWDLSVNRRLLGDRYADWIEEIE